MNELESSKSRLTKHYIKKAEITVKVPSAIPMKTHTWTIIQIACQSLE